MAYIKTQIDMGYSKVIVDLDQAFKVQANFTLKEMANNKSKDAVKAIWNEDVRVHALMLQELRNKLNRALNVNSWYRTATFNKSCGGSSNSLHLKALATDLSFPRLTDVAYKNIENLWRNICAAHGKVGGINRYTNGVHVSSREDLLGYKTFVTRDYRGKTGDW